MLAFLQKEKELLVLGTGTIPDDNHVSCYDNSVGRSSGSKTRLN